MQVEELKSQSLSVTNKLDIVQMGDKHRENANWEVVYGISKLYLTDKEKEHLVSEILKAHCAEFGIENVRNGVKAYFYMSKKVPSSNWKLVTFF